MLDLKFFKRRTRGYLGLAAVTTMTIIVWSCGLAWQVTFTRVSAEEADAQRINHTDENYKGKGALYFFCE